MLRSISIILKQVLFGLGCLLLMRCHSNNVHTGAGSHVIFSCFDGASDPGDWRKQYGWEYFPSCNWNNWHFDAEKQEGKMFVDGGYAGCPPEGNNQHVIRYDKTVDATRPYTIECDFIIEPTFVSPVNSFCVNFNVQKGMSRDSMINCWSLNLDIHDRATGKYTVKEMGFADSIWNEDAKQFENGRFIEMLPSHTGTGALMAPDINHFIIEVNKRLTGQAAYKWVTFTWSDKSGTRLRFETDYSKFPYQPNNKLPVKIGLNTHGTNWTVRNMIVKYAD
ncbi:MAG: hypothetical protein KF862_26045 [Chitinophagaceae bacterium]|nr:hypothetical protein [Chitinophagaceae bacterium]